MPRESCAFGYNVAPRIVRPFPPLGHNRHMSKQAQWIVGLNAVASALEHDAEHVREVLLEAGGKNPRIVEIEGNARRLGIDVRRVAQQVAQAIPGLRGFAGIDVVWHAQRGPVVIEVNPRVTCAYVGLSAALRRPQLAAEILATFAAQELASVA